MEIVSPGGAKRELYANLAFPAGWLEELCRPPFRADHRAGPLWALLLPHLRGQPLPVAGALDLERAWMRLSHRASLEVGMTCLVQHFADNLDMWFRQAPLRFLKLCRLLGSLSPERREFAIGQAAAHPFLDFQGLQLPSENLGQVCLKTWSPLPPPTRVADAVGRQLSALEEGELRLSIANWVPLAQMEILRHYCGARAAAAL